jgi:regulator of RNase E activity RraA
MAVNLALIEQLREFETPTVAESLLALGCSDNHRYFMGSEIKLMTAVNHPMVGIAISLVVDTSTPEVEKNIEGLLQAGDKMIALSLPTIVVMHSVGARMSHECQGAVGLVADGGIRDLDAINQLGFPVYASGVVPDHATLNYNLATEPITVSGVVINHGDLLHGDCNGVHLIPVKYHHAIVEACCLTRDFETRAHILNRRTDLSAREQIEKVGQLASERLGKCMALMVQ